jgi:hypothetical protein
MTDRIPEEYANAKKANRGKAFMQLFAKALMANKSKDDALDIARDAIVSIREDPFPAAAQAVHDLEYRRAKMIGVEEVEARQRAITAAMGVIRRREG